MEKLQAQATYIEDSKRYHRYQIDADEDAEVVGSIYFKKDVSIPKELHISLRVIST